MASTVTSNGSQRPERVLRWRGRMIRGWEIGLRSFWIFWLGGLTFYIAIVVPVGGDILGPQGQGEITARVTVYLNGFGAVAFSLLLADSWIRKNRLSFGLALTMLLLQIALFGLHRELTERMAQDRAGFMANSSFYTVHRIYLWTTTLQWLLAIGQESFMGVPSKSKT